VTIYNVRDVFSPDMVYNYNKQQMPHTTKDVPDLPLTVPPLKLSLVFQPSSTTQHTMYYNEYVSIATSNSKQLRKYASK